MVKQKNEENATLEFIKNLQEKAQYTSSGDESSKILFTGLDNSGKTSIILALQREISQIAMLKPTRQAQRKIFDYLGKQIAEWDLGGQKRYRISYLKEPSRYFENTSVCIYVVDIQDTKRFGEALSYFSDVIVQFKKLELENVKIHVFYHKMDPEYIREKGKVYLEGVISDLSDKISKIVKKEFDLSFHKTTIYDLWSIISSFSNILLEIYPQSELLDRSLQEFAEKINTCEGILLLDSNSLIIGQYFANEDAKELLQKSTPYFLTLNDSLPDDGTGDNKMIVKRAERIFYFDRFNIEKTPEPLYILIMNREKDFPEESIKSLIQILKGLL